MTPALTSKNVFIFHFDKKNKYRKMIKSEIKKEVAKNA